MLLVILKCSTNNSFKYNQIWTGSNICNAMSEFRRKFAAAKLARTDGAPVPIQGHDDIFIGSVGCIGNIHALRDSGITHTLCVGAGVEAPIESLQLELGITHADIGVTDRPDIDISIIFDLCFSVFENCKSAHGKILIYCFQGKSRSVTVLVAYLMKYYNMTFVESLKLIRQTRPSAEPNLGFIVTLRKYERMLQAAAVCTDNKVLHSSPLG